ncbi:glycosyltransferase [Dysgonomonas sp. 520]|nr:glycosyltransferase family 4 protein [Dysgonomonas sp. 520]NDW09984.1 glycosyltransferase [Dysgonomonas sp. 520]
MKKNVRINIILPFKPNNPSGGMSVMLQYANRLSRRGYRVHIYCPLKIPYISYRLPFFLRFLYSKIEPARRIGWFSLDRDIEASYINTITDKEIKDAEIIIATWWSAALEMGKLSSQKGEKINLIQGFEDWEGNKELLYKSYNMKDATNIVVASYLKEIVDKHSEKPSILITNSIDTDVFHITNAIEERNPQSVCMIYSDQQIKGSAYGIEALKVLKEKYPKMQAEVFGVCRRPKNLPEWITYHQKPEDLYKIYNRNAVFVSNSLTEGMSLTPMEAMACGCACVVTGIEGHSEYSVDGETLLLYNVGDVGQLVEKVSQLLNNDEKRVRIARKGNEFIQQFSWDKAVNKLEDIINRLLKN